MSDVDERYICIVCAKLLQEPVMFLVCSHRCCLACLQILRVSEDQNIYRCPIETCGRIFNSAHEVILDGLVKKEIMTTFLKCTNSGSGCQWYGESRHLMQHAEACEYQEVPCFFVNQGCQTKVQKKDLPLHVAEQCPQRMVECQHCRTKMSAYQFIQTSHDRQCGGNQSYMYLLARVQELELEQQASYDGTLVWKIDDFEKNRNLAVSGMTSCIYSPPFFTSRYGYRMRMRIYLNGDGMGKGSHISLVFVLMRGEYDALLPWPFKQKVTIMLLDQDRKEHVMESFRPDPASSSFQKPKSDTNVAFGFPQFFLLSDLHTHAYVCGNVMYIKVIVDTYDLPNH